MFAEESLVTSPKERLDAVSSMSPIAPSRKRSYAESEQNRKVITTKRGYFSLAGRKSEDRLVHGVKILERDGKSVEIDLAIDGHGGSDVATFVAQRLPTIVRDLCQERSDVLDCQLKNNDSWSQLLKEAFQLCNDEWDRTVTTPAQLRAGAVATLILVGDSACMIAHVGDGKAVVNNGSNIEDLTINHRADDPSEKARIERCGGCVFNNRVRGVLAPSRAFGDLLVRTDRNGNVNNHIIRPDPQLVTYAFQGQGCLVVGTDGLFDVIPSQRVAMATSKFLSKVPDANLAARYLAEQASFRSDDDVSVIVMSWS